MIERDQVLKTLREHHVEIKRFGVKSLAVFGSVARNQARSDSDVDILVEFSQPVGLFEFLRFDYYLQDLLGRRVDLVTPDSIRTEFRKEILDEAVYAA